MGITVNALHKRLGKLIKEGHGRKTVCVAKTSFSHNCEIDGCTILPVEGLGIEHIRIVDGDGGTALRKDGTERFRQTCLLVGDVAVDLKGNIVDDWQERCATY